MRLSETQGRKSDQGTKGLRRGGGKEVNSGAWETEDGSLSPPQSRELGSGSQGIRREGPQRSSVSSPPREMTRVGRPHCSHLFQDHSLPLSFHPLLNPLH